MTYNVLSRTLSLYTTTAGLCSVSKALGNFNCVYVCIVCMCVLFFLFGSWFPIKSLELCIFQAVLPEDVTEISCVS